MVWGAALYNRIVKVLGLSSAQGFSYFFLFFTISQTLSANLGPWAKLGDLGTLPILKTIFQRYFETQSHSRTTASLGAIWI